MIYCGNYESHFVKRCLERVLVSVNNWCLSNYININVQKTKYCIYGSRCKLGDDTDTYLTFGNQQILKCHHYNYLGVNLDECLNMNSNYKKIFKKYSHKIYQFGKIRKYITQETHILVYKQTILPLIEYVSFILLFNRSCGIDKLQRLQNRCLHVCLDIHNPRDISVLRLHERRKISYLSMRRYTHLSKLMFNLAQNQKYKKIAGRKTRGNNSYNFETDMGIYSNSPYYIGAKMWNNFPLDIKNMHEQI